MPTKTMREQDGNSCAAHCTVIAVSEIDSGQNMDADFAEDNLWPAIQFQPEGGNLAIQQLVADKNSDPRRIVTEVKKRWPKINAVMVCDEVQKRTALPYVNQAMRADLDAMFNMLAGRSVKTNLKLDELAYYNCSYTMHNAGDPNANNFSGMHNILVTYVGGKTYYYNSNETHPAWKTVGDWKVLKNQNDGNCSYVFSGVCVVLS